MSDMQFGQHVGIAEHLHGEYAKAVNAFSIALRRFMAASSGGPAMSTGEQAVLEKFENAVAVAQNEAQSAWLEAWSQLDQARTIASARGRDLARYDALRAGARTFGAGATFDEGEWLLEPGTRDLAVRRFQWNSGPVAQIRHGIDALRAAMPEVEIAIPLATDVPQLKSSKVLWIVGLIVVAALVGLAVLAMRSRG
jgi:hypothetical protein